MTRHEPPIDDVEVARVLSALADEHAARLQMAEGHTTEQRIVARLEQRATGKRMFSPRRIAVFTLAPAALAAAITALAVTSLAPAPLSYEVRGATSENGTVETKNTPAVLSFSDESEIVARGKSTLDVSVVGEHSALARLSHGHLHVKVQHERDTDWRFLAGPYEVRVIGTEFDLGWQPESRELSVRMHEGRVQVVGPNTKPTILSAGETLELSEAPVVAKQAATKPAVADDADEASEPREGPTAMAVKAPSKALSWSKLVAKGHFADVVTDAERIGIATVLASKPSGELQALAQAAHYSGRSGLALKTWSSIRERFAGQHSSRQAAFFLGRLYDQQGNASQALRWLDTYLIEAGSDVYASEALGRKLTLVRRLRGDGAARGLAEQYLKRFPKGTYARTARSLVE